MLSLPSLTAAGPVRILAFGDSLVAGFALPRKAGFTVQLENILKAHGCFVEVINGGLPGDTSEGGRRRLDQALALEPDLVLIEFGANDNLLGLSPRDLETNLEAIILGFQQGRIPILLTGIAPLLDLGEVYCREFNAVFSRLAEKYRLPFYPDFLSGVAGRPELNKKDGIHPNPEGVRIIVQQLAPLVIKALDSLQKGLP